MIPLCDICLGNRYMILPLWNAALRCPWQLCAVEYLYWGISDIYKIPSCPVAGQKLHISILYSWNINHFILKLTLAPDAIKQLGDEEPPIFCTWEFFEFEIQSTPVLKGPQPEYDFTSQYVVKVDDFFLHYLQKVRTTYTLKQSSLIFSWFLCFQQFN